MNVAIAAYRSHVQFTLLARSDVPHSVLLELVMRVARTFRRHQLPQAIQPNLQSKEPARRGLGVCQEVLAVYPHSASRASRWHPDCRLEYPVILSPVHSQRTPPPLEPSVDSIWKVVLKPTVRWIQVQLPGMDWDIGIPNQNEWVSLESGEPQVESHPV